MVKRPTSPAGGADDNGDDDVELGGRRGLRVDPLVKALLGHLPPPKSTWPPQERQKWIALLSEALGVIYRDADPQPKPGTSGGATAQHPPGSLPTSR